MFVLFPLFVYICRTLKGPVLFSLDYCTFQKHVVSQESLGGTAKTRIVPSLQHLGPNLTCYWKMEVYDEEKAANALRKVRKYFILIQPGQGKQA